MSELHEAFADLRKQNRAEKEPKRLAYACDQLHKYRYSPGGDCLHIHINGSIITFWPFTGWFAGRKPYGKVKGRGIHNLLKELEKIK